LTRFNFRKVNLVKHSRGDRVQL